MAEKNQPQAQRPASVAEASGTRTTARAGRNSRGEPTLYPSEVDGFARLNGLSTGEAERLLLDGDTSDEAVRRVIESRVVYRPRMEAVSAKYSNADTVAYERREAAQRDAEGDTRDPGPDKTQPEAGPYGPNADYVKGVDVPGDVDHTSPAPPKKGGLSHA